MDEAVEGEPKTKKGVRRLEAVCFLVAATTLVSLLAFGQAPDLRALALFAALGFAAENSSILLPSTAQVSPGLMVVMASITAFGHRGVVLGAAVTGMSEISLRLVRQRRWRVLAYNSSAYMLSAAASAGAFVAVEAAASVTLLSIVAAVVAFTVVNIGLVLPAIVLDQTARPSDVWAEMAPALPNTLAFGLLGTLVGQFYNSLGPLALVLLITPVAIARATFRSFLELREAHEATIRVFLRAIRAKDTYTALHTERVAKYSVYIGEELGFSHARLEHLRNAALMHDIGKLAVPKHLLNKPGKLTDDEFQQVQRHAHVCIDILALVDFLAPMTAAAAGHHSRYDGGGYGGTGQHPIEAYVVATADAYDAMTSTRAYRRALPMEVAFEELRSKSGSQFHPECVEGLIRAIERRGEKHGLGYEEQLVDYEVAPPVMGVGSAGLGDLLPSDNQPRQAASA